jgi:hypothetical protein
MAEVAALLFIYVSALIGCGYTLIPPSTYVVANFVEWAIEAYGGTSFTMLKERRAKRQLANVTGYGWILKRRGNIGDDWMQI